MRISINTGYLQLEAGGFLTEYDGVIEHFHLPKSRMMKTIEALEHDTAEDQTNKIYVPESPKTPENDLGTMPMTNNDLNLSQNPKTLRQRAAEAYASRTGSENTQQTLPSIVITKIRRQKRQKGKRGTTSPSTGESDYKSDTQPTPKRPRRSNHAPKPVQRQLRPRKTGP